MGRPVTQRAEPVLGYRLADVFAERRYQGNGVSVFVDPPRLTTDQLLAVTVEVRQFESAFLWPTSDARTFEMRIFVLNGELDFAGHPVLGAAAVLHEAQEGQHDERAELEWTLRLGVRKVAVRSRPDGAGGYDVSMDQGEPTFGAPVDDAFRARVASALNLRSDDLVPDLPVQWVSTGLRYLIVPVRTRALANAKVVIDDLEELLAEVGAELVYVLDPSLPEGRNWLNDGSVEDIATGSAAGPAAAYLFANGRASAGATVELRQGRFLGRPSVMRAEVEGAPEQVSGVTLSGHVCMTGSGTLDAAPA